MRLTVTLATACGLGLALWSAAILAPPQFDAPRFTLAIQKVTP